MKTILFIPLLLSLSITADYNSTSAKVMILQGFWEVMKLRKIGKSYKVVIVKFNIWKINLK